MEAFITLLTSNSYASGALVLGGSLRAAHTTKQLAILITASVSRPIRDRLARVYDALIEIAEIDSHSAENLRLLGRPELGITLTKIHVFNQTQYSKVVFLDADTLVLRNLDHLFEEAANGALDNGDRNTRFAAAPDAGWPDCFNSGVFVCRPKYEDYTGLIEMAGQHGTFDGGDQGLLNSYFDGWSRGDSSNRLPFLYNTTPTSVYSYAPAFQQYKDKLAVVHFVGSFKPWQWLRFADGTVFPRNTSSSDSIALVQQWWNVFDQFVGGKPSDIHEVTHGYDLPPTSQWDHVGLDGHVHEPHIERGPHYEGWFQAYDHQGQKQPPPPVQHHHEHQSPSHEHHHHQQHHDQHQHHEQAEYHNEHHPEHSNLQEHHQEHHQEHYQEHHGGQLHQEGNSQVVVHLPSHEDQWRPPIPPRLAERIDWHHEHHHRQDTQQNQTDRGQEHRDHRPDYTHNPHHMTDYHYQPPPPPPKIPELPEPGSHRYEPNEGLGGQDERQTHHRSGDSESSIDREINPHHLTDYRYRLPATVDSPEAGGGGAMFTAIIPEPVGLPDMYYPNAWDLPEDPRKAYPQLEPKPLEIEDTTNEDNTSVPSGKGRPIFPWESGGPNAPRTRTPSRTYYNYAANAEERRRQKELEEASRLEFEEAALEQIRMQEYARYEQERKKEEAQEQMTGSQAFENFRLVNAWDVDLGVQISMLQKTEKRRPRSRKGSAGGIRKGYGLEDMLAFEAKQRQEQYEAELVRTRLEEEEKWAKEAEEARQKEEEMRLEQVRLAKITKIKAEQRQREQEEGSLYVFRNAWDPPNLEVTKKKLRIEDEEITLALPLRQDRRSAMDVSKSGGTAASGKDFTQISSAARSVRGATAVAAAAAGAAGIAITAESRSGIFERSANSVSEDTIIDIAHQGAKSGAALGSQALEVSNQHQTAAIGLSAGGSGGSFATLQHARGTFNHTSGTRTVTAASAESITTTDSTKMTAAGSHRFVRTIVTTTITRRKFRNGVEVSSSSSSSSTGGEKMFEIPAGPRSGSYFGSAARRTVTLSDTTSASRLTQGAQVIDTRNTRRVNTSPRATENRTGSRYEQESMASHEAHLTEGRTASSNVRKAGQRTTTTTTTALMSRTDGKTASSEVTSSEVESFGNVFAAGAGGEPKRQHHNALALQINTRSLALDREEDEEEALEAEERQHRLDLREKNASATAVAEAMQVLSKYPQATSRYAARPVSTSSGTSHRHSTGGALYANDPNLPRSSVPSSYSGIRKGTALRVQAVRAATCSSDEDDLIFQDEDLEELEYFGEKHTRATLPLGSPYMPSTPLVPSSQRYAASASGFSSRAGSRPTTPGPGTPSRLGPGTPKAFSKRPFSFDLKQLPDKMTQITTSAQQTAPVDQGFSNYKIEWNWKELLGKKPRHWTAEEGEEYYDPYNALSTHGSVVDSEEDGRMLESSSESDSDEEGGKAHSQHERSGSEGSSSGGILASKGQASSPGFAAGEDTEFERDSGFVIRGGKIARRRSSMALDRRELQLIE